VSRTLLAWFVPVADSLLTVTVPTSRYGPARSQDAQRADLARFRGGCRSQG